MRITLGAGLVAAALVLGGCSSTAAPDSSVGVAASSDNLVLPASSDTVVVPDVSGLKVGPATSSLKASGLTVRRLDVLGTACRPRGEVLGQRPRAGRLVDEGRQVAIEVNSGALGDCGLDAVRADRELRKVAGRFVRFARGNAEGPPADTPIILMLGGGRTKMLAGERQHRVRAWGSCPGGGSYAGWTCPINPVRLLRNPVGPLAYLAEPPDHPCAHPQPATPAEVGASRSVSITPDEGRDCTSFWTVQLFVDDVGQVVAVNTVLSEP